MVGPEVRGVAKRDRDIEYKVLQIIKEAGLEGILQSHLWKRINASSREGSRVSLRLEKAGLVDRRRELHEGKWTYRLVAKKRAVTIDSILSLPCLFCIEQDRCTVGGPISPITCELMTKLVQRKAPTVSEG